MIYVHNKMTKSEMQKKKKQRKFVDDILDKYFYFVL